MLSRFSNTSSTARSKSQTAGRFAFPAGSLLTPEQKLRVLEDIAWADRERESELAREEAARSALDEKERAEEERAWQKRKELEEQRHRERRERELEEALKGEKHWVRMGGILRDADSRRDYKRTEEIRKLVEKEDAELRIINRWMAYENAWTNIISSTDKLVTFAEMPWPLVSPPKHPDELRDPSKIAEFLFESLTLEQNKTTRKERLRMSLLRWHPDKLGSVLARVPEEEINAVKDGIDGVVISLMKLQEAEKIH